MVTILLFMSVLEILTALGVFDSLNNHDYCLTHSFTGGKRAPNNNNAITLYHTN